MDLSDEFKIKLTNLTKIGQSNDKKLQNKHYKNDIKTPLQMDKVTPWNE